MTEATALSLEQMRSAIDAFFGAATRGEYGAMADVFSVDAVVEDPKGGPRHEGREAIREFYTGMGGLLESIRLEASHVYPVAGGAAARWIGSWKGRNGRSGDLEGIDVYTFDGEGQLTSLTGFWDAAGLVAEATAS